MKARQRGYWRRYSWCVNRKKCHAAMQRFSRKFTIMLMSPDSFSLNLQSLSGRFFSFILRGAVYFVQKRCDFRWYAMFRFTAVSLKNCFFLQLPMNVHSFQRVCKLMSLNNANRFPATQNVTRDRQNLLNVTSCLRQTYRNNLFSNTHVYVSHAYISTVLSIIGVRECIFLMMQKIFA